MFLNSLLSEEVIVRDNLDILLQKMKGGDEEAFGKLYELTSRQVFSYLLSIVNDYHTAQDLTQDTFVKIRQSVGSYQSKNAFAWIMQIAKNTAYSERRKSKRCVPTDFDAESGKYGSYTVEKDEIPVLEIVRTRLDDVDSKIILMHVSAGYKHREIADELKIPLGTVLWRYNKAIKKLQKIIKEEYGK